MITTPTATTDPIISRLRPRSVGEILDQAFRLYRKHFLTFLAIIAVIYVPLQLAVQVATLALIGSSNLSATSALGSSGYSYTTTNELALTESLLGLVVIVLAVAAGLLQYLSQGALTAGVADSYLERPVSFGGSYRQMLKRIGPLFGIIGLQVAVWIAIASPVALLFIVGLTAAGLGASNAGVGFGAACLGLFLLLPLGILFFYIVVRLAVVIPAVMVEKLGPVQAWKRSWRLVMNYWWRTLGIIIALSLLGAVVSAGPAYLIQMLVLLAVKLDPVVSQALLGGVQILTGLVFVPLQLISMTLYYFDLRVRKEGFDIETAIEQRYWPGAGGMMPQTAMAGVYPQYGQTNQGMIAPPALGYGAPQPTYQQGAYKQGGIADPIEPVYGQPATIEGYAQPSGAPEAGNDTAPGNITPTAPEQALQAPQMPPPTVAVANRAYGQSTAPVPDWLARVREKEARADIEGSARIKSEAAAPEQTMEASDAPPEQRPE
ncbi:MAG: glycerophosphoryl diester phosphodiesterase membrane domain-containing protein [Chloroflexi bacterium]|nr:glycerophosphoryl diester phosphodiesterase membrane domain-containing protein [Chloroflexota bacterium]